MRFLFATAFLLSNIACQATEMAQSWQVDRTRVLAIKAEVVGLDGTTSSLAEAQPGETINLSALLVHPELPSTALWLGCSDSPLGCFPSEEFFELLGELGSEDMTPEEFEEFQAQAQEAGLVGIEPFLPATYTFGEDFLDHLTDEEKLEGDELQITIFANPIVDGEIDESDTEIANKRIPVSTTTTPNHNPDILHLLINGEAVSLGDAVSVIGGDKYEIEPILIEAPEDYTFVTSDGEPEVRTEDPYFNFYTTGGSYDTSYSLHGDFQSVTWTAPNATEADQVTIWVVSRDRRGGMGWIEQTFLIE
tara:strand:- start:533 stop:1450 length:918 start_codon:yes stop_codon:yes gene_type:complete